LSKKKLKTTTITIDEEVWKILNNRKKLGRDSHNGVLRRLLGLDTDEPTIIVEDGAIIVEDEVVDDD